MPTDIPHSGISRNPLVNASRKIESVVWLGRRKCIIPVKLRPQPFTRV